MGRIVLWELSNVKNCIVRAIKCKELYCGFLFFRLVPQYNSLHVVAPTIQFFTFGSSHSTILYTW